MGKPNVWGPTLWGRVWTQSPDWQLTIKGSTMSLDANGRTHWLDVEEETSYRIRRGVWWTDLTVFPDLPQAVKVDGLPNDAGDPLAQALARLTAGKRVRDALAQVQCEHQKIAGWLTKLDQQKRLNGKQQRWFTYEQQAALAALRPTVDVEVVRKGLQTAAVRDRLGAEAATIERDLTRWDQDQSSARAMSNKLTSALEVATNHALFARVESQPLTQEQAKAVVCFDNRVLVVAAAGSGKTSTMVAKAVYAIHRGLVAPERIILLAFNKPAAEELKERAAKAFARLGMEGVSVETSTFHALGLRIIGKATGEKPDIPEWATDRVGGVRKLAELVDQLKDRSPEFRSNWDLFRFVFGRDLPAFGAPDPADVWDAEGNGRLRTSRGETVRSQEEVMIANWLFLNGVNYCYEPRYEFATADEDHRQYKPDFHYPDINLYHEHFALDAQGRAPAHFEGYVEGVEWKRALHSDKGTALFETTSHGLRRGDDLNRLAAELTGRGVVLDPNPDREIPTGGSKPMETAELIGLVRTFISHTKSNCLTVGGLRQRLDSMPADTFKHRHRMFLDLVGPVMEAWDAALATEGGIDFDDMLNLAAAHLESGRYECPFELVMADEFQDASHARARLCRAMVQPPGRFFFAVGDDWQSINRFAGADVSVMTQFREYFGHGELLKLEESFRCPQALCDLSSAFVSKNPAQISKQVRSNAPEVGPVLQGFQVDQKDQLAEAIDQFVMKLAEGVRAGTIPPGRNGKVSVYVLGRYNADKQYVPARKSRFERFVEVSFITVHRSKGSEADYVILPEMVSVRRGRSFPDTRADDPVLALAMPGGDDFPLGEERRLFYVALTRARRSVAMFTARGQYSSFLRELAEDGAVIFTDTEGNAVREENCPSCKQGVLVLRTGPYGEFRSCSSFPACSYKPRRLSNAATSRSATSSRLVPTQHRSAGVALPPAPPTPPPASQAKPRHTLASIFSVLNDKVGELNRNVERAAALQSATSELEMDIYVERITIEKALERAKSDVDLELRLQKPGFREIYEATYKELDTLMGPAEPDPSGPERSVPNLERFLRHSDPDVNAAILRKVDGLRETREGFLSVTHAELARDAGVRARFLSRLQEFDGERYLAGLDPRFSLTR